MFLYLSEISALLTNIETLQETLCKRQPVDFNLLKQKELSLIEQIKEVSSQKFDEEEKQLIEVEKQIEECEIAYAFWQNEYEEAQEKLTQVTNNLSNLNSYEANLKLMHEEQIRQEEDKLREEIVKNIDRRNYLQKLKMSKLNEKRTKK
ncbi:hypothetical protein SteCoe_29682 [Stentor coeruleus]|uniref:Uncharacterized protein n=1 Tax=Stentor coeruleus TaxID=5963 RepID=A0A1R2B5M7_9CILI|nr:hypothetical protein SteCoe_29682 [Stentor coeruleus]